MDKKLHLLKKNKEDINVLVIYRKKKINLFRKAFKKIKRKKKKFSTLSPPLWKIFTLSIF